MTGVLHVYCKPFEMKSTSAKRVGMFIYYSRDLRTYPSVVNSAIMWARNGFSVDIVIHREEEKFRENPSFSEIIHTLFIAYKRKSGFLKKISTFFRFAIEGLNCCWKKKYLCLIGYDHEGLLLAT